MARTPRAVSVPLRGSLSVAGAILGMIVLASGSWAQAPEPEVVALTGRPVPSVASSSYTSLGHPAVNAVGKALFTAEYNAPGGFRRALMQGGSAVNGTSVLRREADPVAELGGLPAAWTGAFSLPAAGGTEVAFIGEFTGPMAGSGLWHESGLPFLLRATTAAGVNAPGMTGRFSTFHAVGLAAGGELVLRASAATGANADTGLWVAAGSGVAPYQFEGDLPPDVPAGVEYDDLGSLSNNPVVNPGGVVAFLAPLRGNVTSATNRAIVVGPPSGERTVARTGWPAAGMPEGAVFASLGPPGINIQNDVVFSARVIGGGVGPNDDEGVWIVRYPSTTLSLVVREGIMPTGAGQGVLLHERTAATACFRETVIDSTERIAFVSGLLGPGINNQNDSVLYAARRDASGEWTLSLLAREGQDAPGLTPGTDRYGVFGLVWLNGRNQIAFTNQIGNQTWALFAGEPGMIGLIVAADRTLDVGTAGAPDLRRVGFFYNQFGPSTSSGGGGSGDGLGTCLAQDGVVVFRAEFTDNSAGVFERTLSLAADLSGDGAVSVQDLYDFLQLFFAMNPLADANHDGVLSVQDIFDYLNKFFASL